MGSRLQDLLKALTILVILGVFIANSSLDLEIAHGLFLGWVIFIAREAPRLTISWEGILTAAVCLPLLAGSLHGLLKWFVNHRPRPAGHEAEVGRWRFRWTAGILGLVLAMLVAGISMLGIAHQVFWIASSPERFKKYQNSIFDLPPGYLDQRR